jgi:UDPglucose 6-dehydrogenase
VIAVFGLGFVGLTTALGFASKGMRVSAYDSSAQRLAEIRSGRIPFAEPGLAEALASTDLLTLADSPAQALVDATVVFICVGTPTSPSGRADLTAVFSCLDSVLAAPDSRTRRRTIVVKSTVPPGSCRDHISPHIRARGFNLGPEIGLAANPEFLREGRAWDDFMNPDRIVVGADDTQSAAIVAGLYSSFDAPVHGVSLTTAEFIKYLSNTLLATLISFSNEMALAARRIQGIDIAAAFRIVHADGRWSGAPAPMSSYCYPGCGFGGYCLPKDTLAMHRRGVEAGARMELLDAVLRVNSRVREELLEEFCRQQPPPARVAVLGLAFKPGSDDVRDTPSAFFVRELIRRQYAVVAYDPLAMKAFDEVWGMPVKYAGSMDEALAGADAALVLTGWEQFRDLRGRTEPRIHDWRYLL